MYREDKATQLAGYLITRAGGKCNYTVLLKMLYACDRAMIETWGMPITYDKWVSMHCGPVLSATYDLIKRANRGRSVWRDYIRTEGYNVTLITNPGEEMLSDAEIEIANKVFSVMGGMQYGEAIELTHQKFPEWTDPGETSVPISVSDMLGAMEQAGDEYVNEVESHFQANELLAP